MSKFSVNKYMLNSKLRLRQMVTPKLQSKIGLALNISFELQAKDNQLP